MKRHSGLAIQRAIRSIPYHWNDWTLNVVIPRHAPHNINSYNDTSSLHIQTLHIYIHPVTRNTIQSNLIQTTPSPSKTHYWCERLSTITYCANKYLTDTNADSRQIMHRNCGQHIQILPGITNNCHYFTVTKKTVPVDAHFCAARSHTHTMQSWLQNMEEVWWLCKWLSQTVRQLLTCFSPPAQPAVANCFQTAHSCKVSEIKHKTVRSRQSSNYTISNLE